MREEKVIKFVQEMLNEERQNGSDITSELIDDNIALVLKMKPQWGEGLNLEAVMEELIRRFSSWYGESTFIQGDDDHKAWLVAARKQGWRYWQRYREYLERKLSPDAIASLDKTTDEILGLLEDPLRDGHWDRRGLVVGHVQSGKTGNYTGLICKAADAGYKIIIVLAGQLNNLRAQTQIRLDEGFLGFKTTIIDTNLEVTGVGEIDNDLAIKPNFATTRADNGDFNTRAARNMGITPEQRPWLFVVKKNGPVLRKLHEWLRNHVANAHDQETGRKLVTNLPLLMIDDEADHASVDTGAQRFDEDGKTIDDYQPKAINSLIRKVLHTFTRKSYVGYTATPFANIFIHEKGSTKLEGSDLFPAAFILNLPTSSDHIGPSRIFGLGDESGLPLIVEIKDTSGWMPPSHPKDQVPKYGGEDRLPPSLEEAILTFLISCAVRNLRGQEKEHASMLIHVTRYTFVQDRIYQQVETFLKGVRQRLEHGIDRQALEIRLRNLWESGDSSFVKVNNKMRALEVDLRIKPLPTFDEVLAVLPGVAQDINVKTINGTAKDALDYEQYKDTGFKVIAIGGEKLSRGLTLEGLSVSYFLRASKMYDTLMQMGRWFGYRPGYLDVCRLYISPELVTWFKHITDASEELREEFDIAVNAGLTPRQYGLKVKSHSTLMVTSPLKMRAAKDLLITFSGQLLETVAMFRDEKHLRHNLDTTINLIKDLGKPDESPIERKRGSSRQRWEGALWRMVPSDKIINFLHEFETHKAAYKVDTEMLSSFIEKMNAANELTEWTVALIGAAGKKEYPLTEDLSVSRIERSALPGFSDRYSIRRLITTRDESIDLDDNQWEAALELTKKTWHADPGRSRRTEEPDEPSGPSIRKIRGLGCPERGLQAHPEQGLMLLYMIDPEKSEIEMGPTPVVGMAISFPGSKTAVCVKYKVNNVLWEQEYGPAE